MNYSVYQEAVDEYVASQPWYVRRKDSITAVAGMILQIANLLVMVQDKLPIWSGAVIAAVIGLCQLIVHAKTPGAITPSMGERLEETGPAVAADFHVTTTDEKISSLEVAVREAGEVLAELSSAINPGRHAESVVAGDSPSTYPGMQS